jgi:hypothetical protein
MKHLRVIGVLLFALALFVPLQDAGAKAPEAGKNMLTKRCLNCHKTYKTMDNIITGTFKSRSNKAKSIQIKLDDRMELVKFTAETTVKNVPNIKALKEPIPVRVHYQQVGDDLVATRIVAKPKMKVPKEQLMETAELEKLVAMGPDKGGYTLVDSRPAAHFSAGHIPTSLSIPFPKMKAMTDKLPQDKNRLLIFYCAGMR